MDSGEQVALFKRKSRATEGDEWRSGGEIREETMSALWTRIPHGGVFYTHSQCH